MAKCVLGLSISTYCISSVIMYININGACVRLHTPGSILSVGSASCQPLLEFCTIGSGHQKVSRDMYLQYMLLFSIQFLDCCTYTYTL